MLGVLVLIGATMYQLRNRSLAERGRGANAARAHQAAVTTNPDKARWTETVIEGPADESPIEQEEIHRFFEVVADKQLMSDVDMPAYWRLLKWSRRRSFAELEQRAKRDVPFSQLWELPDKHRGELIRLQIRVRQIVKQDDIPDNSAGVTTTYDLAGGTSESRGNPYLVVCSELPPEIRVATKTDQEVVFVGYFLKILKYEGFAATRGAPVLIGRVRPVPSGAHIAASRSEGLVGMLVIGVAVIVAVIVLVAVYRVTRQTRRPPRQPVLSALSNDNIENWLENIPADEADPADTTAPRFSTAMAGNGQAHHPAAPESNGHAGE
jgi:hypothetical protein